LVVSGRGTPRKLSTAPPAGRTRDLVYFSFYCFPVFSLYLLLSFSPTETNEAPPMANSRPTTRCAQRNNISRFPALFFSLFLTREHRGRHAGRGKFGGGGYSGRSITVNRLGSR